MKTLKIFLILLCALALNACETFVEGVDEKDPTRPVDADLSLVMTGMEVEYLSTLEGEMARTAGLWTGYFTGSDRQYINLYNYLTTAGDYDSPWGNVYTFTFKQARIVQEKATAINNKLSLGVGQIVEAHVIGTAAGVWGDVPYVEAIKHESFPNPKYDAQAEVFTKLIALLDDAIGNLSSGVGDLNGEFLSGGGAPGVVLSGVPAKWIKVANSLKARYYLYQKNYAKALESANAGVNDLASNLMAPHGTTNDQDRNIYFDFHERQRSGYLTAKNAFLALMLDPAVATSRNNTKTNETTRFKLFYSKSADGDYDINVSDEVPSYFGTAASFPLMSAFENKLIAAECAARLNGVAAGLAVLNEHRALLRAEYPTGTYTDFVAGDFTSGGLENADGKGDLDALLREILEEKYVSLYGQIEVFNEIRRTNNAVGVPPNSGDRIPQRFLYSQNEINANTSTPNPIPDLYTKTSIFQ
ncbi:SusD/RagB family nutrient-binding outer membrane lipoprotein [Chryseolinea lacunae]|uniref:SusD/RagB family nutrient-binding outer membrane lipoprotein n=1 Tax=Chryseolinea lacunae TaxID=2801331 RepID=A0ABS1KNC2_9BACT|nr:SusD/RagB family nutrient-binding outer membrane lipoprotein [Chryseolinea lacunae]MBL0740839.1 SusD/RagB family nutrient-binding outer membrane lipoprotein [Chryseolinea lacunae]